MPREKTSNAIANAAAFGNLSKEFIGTLSATGFQTNSLRYRCLGQQKRPRAAEDFLLNSRLVRRDRETETSIISYFSDAAALTIALTDREPALSGAVVPLPKSAGLLMELGEVLRRRRSIRRYTGDQLELSHLATMLRAGFGVTGTTDLPLSTGGQRALNLRAAPSGGGLYPIEALIASLNVKDLSKGIFRLIVSQDSLSQTGGISDLTSFLDSFAAPEEFISLSSANAVILLVARPWRSMRKYGDRGLRLVLIEAGEIAAQINLAATALGLGTLDCASFYDDEIHEAIGVDGLYQTLVHAIIIGHGA